MKPAIKKLYDEMTKINNKILAYQKRCKHKNLIETPGANAGHLSDVDNKYWTECKCPDCNKYWIRHEDSE